jgi:hypothetical protein
LLKRQINDPNNQNPRPVIAHLRASDGFLHAVNGTSAKRILQMIGLIHEQTGTPQNHVDWVNSAEWTPERLRAR